MHKTWIVIVTCSSSRALYSDVVENCSSALCLNMLKRYINQYGALKQILSDNGSAFTSKEVKEFISLNGVKWSHNIAEAPWDGGFVERIVSSVKRCLKKVLGQASVRFDELLTIFKKLENVCNNRPPTYICDGDINEPLSPNHLIHGRAIATRCEDIVNYERNRCQC